jgi:hypothetical protein
MSLTCATCGEKAAHQCAQCRNIAYCSRDCQAVNWAAHKALCKETSNKYTVYNDFIGQANEKIIGNILIMASHRYQEPGAFIVKIDETAEEFTRGNTVHFAHLYHTSNATCGQIKYNNTAPPAACGRISIIYLLKNYQHTIITALARTRAGVLKNKYSDPGNLWSIFFEI